MIRKAALLAVLPVALLAPATVAAAPGAAASTTAGPLTGSVARQGVTLALSAVTPDYATEQATEIKVTGTVQNTGSTPLTGLRVRVRYSSQPFTDRASLSAYQNDPTPATQPPLVSTQSSMVIAELGAGASAPFELTMTPAQFQMAAFGAYPLTVEVVQWDAVQLASQRTFLTYAPATAQKPVRNRLAVVLPVVDQPRRADDGLFVNDGLGAELTGKGRLADLARIAEAAPKDVTWVVDPALFDDAQAMTRTFKVKSEDRSVEHPPEGAAGQWLASMRAALADNPVIATPYADPDVTALAHQGLDDQPARALELARQKAGLIKAEIDTSTYWPPGGVIDADALDLMAVGGPGGARVERVLLAPAALPPQPPVTTTPDAAATLDTVMGPVTALVADAELSRAFEPGSGAGATLLAKQRFIAETATIAAEPGQTRPRSLVAAPSRRWEPNPTLVSALLKTAGKLPWLTLTPLDSIKPGAGRVPRADLTYTDQDRKKELSGKYLGAVKKVAAQAELTGRISGQPQSAFDAAVLRLASSAWRGGTRAGRAVTELVDDAVEDRIDQVSIIGAGPDRPWSLAGSNGEVPISVRNTLDREIALYIDVRSDNTELLRTDFEQTEPLRIGGDQSGTVQVPITVISSSGGGDATVTVQLMTADGRRYGDPVKLVVRTTGYTGIALVIVGAALTVMLAAVALRILRRRSQRRSARATRTRESEAV